MTIGDGAKLERHASDVEQIMAVLRTEGWTCEYHQPVSDAGECSQCDDSHRKTASAIIDALGLTDAETRCSSCDDCRKVPTRANEQ